MTNVYKSTTATMYVTLHPHYNALQYNVDSVITRLRSWTPIFQVGLVSDEWTQRYYTRSSNSVHIIDCSNLASRKKDGGWRQIRRHRSMVNKRTVNGAAVQCSRPIQ